MHEHLPPPSREILGIRLDRTSYDDVSARVRGWIAENESRYVCACNVHMVMEAQDDPAFRGTVNRADLVVPDGMPLVWTLRMLGYADATRVYGPDLMLALCEFAARARVRVGLYGSTDFVLGRLTDRLFARFRGLEIVYVHSPHGAEHLSAETELERMREAGVQLLFVALGCPKQERWMERYCGRLAATMVGVGAAFDFIAGTRPQAPRLLQAVGLEWAFRLVTEPRRLWKRYWAHNPRFMIRAAKQVITARSGRRPQKPAGDGNAS